MSRNLLALPVAALLVISATPSQGMSATRAQTTCTPTSGYTHCFRFTFQASDQAFAVPPASRGSTYGCGEPEVEQVRRREPEDSPRETSL